MLKFGLVTLGCDKNTVDSERYLADLVAYGGEQVTDLREAEVVVVNTCGFIDAAKADLALWQGIAISALSLTIGWILYDLMCKSALGDHPTFLMLLYSLIKLAEMYQKR